MVIPGIYFFCGDDEFIISEKGRAIFDEKKAAVSDPFMAEIIEGNVNNIEELAKQMGLFSSSVQTLSMFGDGKVIWFRGINFLGDTVTGRSEGAKPYLEQLQSVLERVDSNSTQVILTAMPIDRRKSFYKWAKSNLAFEDIVADKSGDQVVEKMIRETASSSKVRMADDAVELLIRRVNGDSRMAVNEVKKLALYLGLDNAEITYELVHEMVPSFGEGNQFEAVEEFFSLNLKSALVALRRHFFFNRDERMLISSILNQNRLLIQLRTLIDSGALKVGKYGLNQKDLNAVAEQFSDIFEGVEGKSNLNIFSQHPYYISRLVKTAAKRECKLATLMRFNQVFVEAFEKILSHPNTAESILRDAFVRCLHRGSA
jgi:DNA polymerase-3 subunit delta